MSCGLCHLTIDFLAALHKHAQRIAARVLSRRLARCDMTGIAGGNRSVSLVARYGEVGGVRRMSGANAWRCETSIVWTVECLQADVPSSRKVEPAMATVQVRY